MSGQCEERFERRYGFWRGFVDEQVRRYLDCVLYENGFVRVRCPDYTGLRDGASSYGCSWNAVMDTAKGLFSVRQFMRHLARPTRRIFDCDDTFSLDGGDPPGLKIRIGIAVILGLLAVGASVLMDHPIRFQGARVGDIGPPIIGAKLFLDGRSPYSLALREGAITLYPFTTSVVLSPFLTISPTLWAPVFSGLITGLFAFAIISRGKPWQLLALVSPCYIAALHSVQWSPVLTASLLLPFLLPLAVVKPQLGLVLVACGRWRPSLFGIAAALVGLSVALLPTWPLAWITRGNLDLYAGKAPFTLMPGLLLLSASFLWRKRCGRLLLLMSIIRQRYFYDQLLLFLIPRTPLQMIILVGTSWIGGFAAISLHPVDLFTEAQHHDVWLVIILTVYLPALGILWFNYWSERMKARAVDGEAA